MSRLSSLRGGAAVAVLVWLVTGSRAGEAAVCVEGPLYNPSTGDSIPDNRLRLCSPEADEAEAQIELEGLRLSWDAPPRSETSYVGPVVAFGWTGIDTNAVVPAMQLRGTYLGVRDRLIQLTVNVVGPDSVAVLGDSLQVSVGWLNVHGAKDEPVRQGSFLLTPQTIGRTWRFDSGPTSAPDTTTLAGLRIVFQAGHTVRDQDTALFDVQDFEGFHVWRWGADPLATDPQIIGEYSKLANTADPVTGWIQASPDARRFTFIDRNVFDGFTYHYAITSYDQGYRRSTGTTRALKIDSPAEPGGPTQIRVEFRREPPETFQPIVAVPNPFYDASIDPRREETNFVFFTNAPARGTLFIYSLAGDLVLERPHDQAAVGTISWDTRNGRGQRVASGIYIYKIVDLVSGQQSYGRLAVIR
jgi:hypothetical protein